MQRRIFLAGAIAALSAPAIITSKGVRAGSVWTDAALKSSPYGHVDFPRLFPGTRTPMWPDGDFSVEGGSFSPGEDFAARRAAFTKEILQRVASSMGITHEAIAAVLLSTKYAPAPNWKDKSAILEMRTRLIRDIRSPVR